MSDEAAAGNLRDFLTRAVLTPLSSAAEADDAELRAAMAASQMVGLAVTRYVVELEPVASAPADVLAPALGPTLDRYLTGPL